MTLRQRVPERAVAAEVTIRHGVEFTLVLIEPGLWRWRFQIAEAATTGTTKTNLRGMAAHRVKTRIDRELNKPRRPAW
jgi:hypothetical protein